MKGIKVTKKVIAALLCALMVFFSISAAAESTWDWREETNTSGKNPVAHTHVYSDWVITKKPTCVSAGERQRTCIYATETDASGNPTNVCGYVYTEEIPADPSAHTKGSVITTKEATCSSVGISTYECSGCHKSITVYLETKPHTYDENAWYVVEPVHEKTLERNGKKTNRCTVCAKTVEIVIPVEHTYKEGGSVVTAPTCTKPGSMLKYCTVCNKSKLVDIPVDEDNHVYSGKALPVGPVDCVNGGRGIVDCEACGELAYVDIPASEAHDYLEWEYTAATGDCKTGTNGSIMKRCKTCDKVFETKYWSAHTLGDDARTHAATCSDYGYSKGTCTVCGATDVEVVIAPDEDAHSWIEEVLIEPTCDEDSDNYGKGYVFRMCKYDSSHREYTDIPAKEHTYTTDWTITKVPTCHSEGEKINDCIVCGKKVIVELPIDPDNHPIEESEWSIYDNQYPSCTKAGVEAAHCKWCVSDDELVFREVPKHTGTLVEYERTEATCCLEGEITYKCYECSATVIEKIPVNTGVHRPSADYWIVRPATCSEKIDEYGLQEGLGIRAKVCDYCMIPIMETTGDNAFKTFAKKSHIVSDWTITKSETCTEDGSKTRHCTVEGCGYEETVAIAKSHRYQAWVVKSPATCTTRGLRERGCYNCNETWTETYYADHTPGEWKFVKGNCKDGGTAKQYCTGCDYAIDVKTVAAGEHINLREVDDPDFVPTDSVCTRKAYYCEACKETLYVNSGHTFIKTSDAFAPTCTEKGSTAGYYCPLCKVVVKPKVIEATGHNFEYDEEGTKYCLNCTLYYIEGGTSETCDHFCHNKGTIAKIMTKIFTFFWKILDKFSLEPKYQYCECGLAHYELED